MNDTKTEETQASTAVAVTSPQKVPVLIGHRGLEIKDLDSLWRVSQYISKSGLAPKGIETPEAIFVALEMGMELGLPAMAALQNIAVINGRPGVFGDIQLALVRSSGLLEDYAESEVGKPGEDSWGVQCVCKRSGCKFANSTFTVADAKRAGLWGKQGPWTQYPKRMLKFRARGFLLRDEFGDVLKGIKSVEELQDLDAEERFQRAKVISGPLGEAPKEDAPSTVPTPPRKGPTLVETPLTDDEKAEADAGLAPEQSKGGSTLTVPADPAGSTKAAAAPTTGAAASPLGPGEMTADQAKCAELVEFIAGCTFDDFRKYAKVAGWEADWDSIGGWPEVPEEIAHMFVAARRATIKALQESKARLL